MAYKYNFIDHTADVAVELSADTEEELFSAAADAFRETVFENAQIDEREEKIIELDEETLEELLVSFVDELNFLFQKRKWVMKRVKDVRLTFVDYNINLMALMSGEQLDEDKHNPKTEIKAVTFHLMDIKQTDDMYITRLVFDI